MAAACRDDGNFWIKLLINQVHQKYPKHYDVFTEIGKDSHTIYHRKFYDKIDSGWEEFTNLYQKFAEEVVLPHLGLSEALVQVFPSFRAYLSSTFNCHCYLNSFC